MTASEANSQEPLEVTFIRHDKTRYAPEALTEEGITHAREAATKIVDRLDKDTDIVAIWESPTARTSKTADILKEELTQRGIPVLLSKREDGKRKILLLADRKRTESTTRAAMHKIYPDKLDDDLDVLINMLNAEIDFDGEGETHEHMWKRYALVVSNLFRVAREVHPEGGKRLNVILVGHGMFATQLLNAAHLIESDTAVTTTDFAEEVIMSLNTTDNTIDVKYRGSEGAVHFDKETNAFTASGS